MKRNQKPKIPQELFVEKIVEQFDKLEYAFNKVAQENEPGKVTVKRTSEKMVVTVKKVGNYTLSFDLQT